MQYFSIICLLSIILNLSIYVLSDNNEGWRMIDRFYGFRYVIHGEQITNQQILETIQSHAHTLGCFGWVQIGKTSDNIAGEARCSKSKGKIFYEWLETLPGSTQFESLILEPTRDTCFLDLPHQCSDISDRVKQAMEHTSTKHTTADTQTRTEEL